MIQCPNCKKEHDIVKKHWNPNQQWEHVFVIECECGFEWAINPNIKLQDSMSHLKEQVDKFKLQ